jgi:hypothetical protein
MQEKLTSWFLGLPAIVILLVLMLVALFWFGGKHLNKREAFWQAQSAAKDAMIRDIIDKMFALYNDAINRETTTVQELRRMQEQIEAWFRK